jgi:hypothetical protein
MESRCSKFGDSATSAGLSRIRLMFNFKNIDVAMSLGLRDDCLGAMISFIPRDYIHIPAS